MWTDGNGAFVYGQCPAGWRAATEAEVSQWQQAQAAVVPESITDKQFFVQLALQGDITQADAMAYLGPGTLPKLITDAIGRMPAQGDVPAATVQFLATADVTGAHTFERHNPTTMLLGQLLGKTDAQLDAIWVGGAKL